MEWIRLLGVQAELQKEKAAKEQAAGETKQKEVTDLPFFDTCMDSSADGTGRTAESKGSKRAGGSGN